MGNWAATIPVLMKAHVEGKRTNLCGCVPHFMRKVETYRAYLKDTQVASGETGIWTQDLLAPKPNFPFYFHYFYLMK